MSYDQQVLFFSVSVLIRIGDKSEKKPVFQVELVPEEQLVVFISGKFLYPCKLCWGKVYCFHICLSVCVHPQQFGFFLEILWSDSYNMSHIYEKQMFQTHCFSCLSAETPVRL